MLVANGVGRADNSLVDRQHPFWNRVQSSWIRHRTALLQKDRLSSIASRSVCRSRLPRKKVLHIWKQAAKRGPVFVVWPWHPGWYDAANLRIKWLPMIDNQSQVERLLHKLTEAMPLPAMASPALMAELCGRFSTNKVSLDCRVTEVT